MCAKDDEKKQPFPSQKEVNPVSLEFDDFKKWVHGMTCEHRWTALENKKIKFCELCGTADEL